MSASATHEQVTSRSPNDAQNHYVAPKKKRTSRDTPCLEEEDNQKGKKKQSMQW